MIYFNQIATLGYSPLLQENAFAVDKVLLIIKLLVQVYNLIS